MNKYQEALDRLEEVCLPLSTFENPMPKNYGDDIDTIQDLINKYKNMKKAYEIVIGKLCYMQNSEDLTPQGLFICSIEEVNTRIKQMNGE